MNKINRVLWWKVSDQDSDLEAEKQHQTIRLKQTNKTL